MRWQGAASRQKGRRWCIDEQSCMDEVIRSGSKRGNVGVEHEDEMAGATIATECVVWMKP